MQFSQDAARDLTEVLSHGASYWLLWAERGVRVAIILAGAATVTFLFKKLFQKLRQYAVYSMHQHGGATEIELEKRSNTLTRVMTKAVTTLIWMLAAVMALHELTFNVEPLIAGLGIAGVALGLGSQTLIKDWLGGFFLLIEDQIRIGDSVSINGTSGGVEELNLRTTVLRSENGAVHVIPNGAITQISNFTRGYSYYVFETTLAHGAAIAKALEILKLTGEEIAADPDFSAVILAPIEVMGVDKLNDKGVVIRARIKTLPSKQALVGRELNRRVAERFAASEIAFPSF